jgi:hypothetical protein
MKKNIFNLIMLVAVWSVLPIAASSALAVAENSAQNDCQSSYGEWRPVCSPNNLYVGKERDEIIKAWNGGACIQSSNKTFEIVTKCEGNTYCKNAECVSPTPENKTTRTCINQYCEGVNSRLTEVRNADGKSNTDLGVVCCDGNWWVNTQGSNWTSSCNGKGFEKGGWYICGDATVSNNGSEDSSSSENSSTGATTLSIETNTLPSGKIGTPYRVGMKAAEFDGTPTWSITGLPAGLSLDEGGICIRCVAIEGTPTTAGTYTVKLTLTVGSQSVSKQFSLLILSANSTDRNITKCIDSYCSGKNSKLTEVRNTKTGNSNDSLGTVCCDGNWWIDVKGSNWLSSCNGKTGGLEAGGWYTCNENQSTATTINNAVNNTVISTINSAVSAVVGTVSSVVSSIGSALGISGNDPLEITTTQLHYGTVGMAYDFPPSYALGANGGTGTYSFSATGLPSGLHIEEDVCKICGTQAEIHGTPTTAGTYTVNVTATSGSQSVSKQFSLIIYATRGEGNRTATCVNDFCSGDFAVRLTDVRNANGQSNAEIGSVCCDDYWWTNAKGSNWDSSCTGEGGWYACNGTTAISNNESSDSSESSNPSSTNSNGATNTDDSILRINTESSDLGTLQVGVPLEYAQVSVNANGLFPTYTGSATGLPPGISFAWNETGIARGIGRFSGTPTQAGTYTINVTVNAGGQTASKHFTMTVK